MIKIIKRWYSSVYLLFRDEILLFNFMMYILLFDAFSLFLM